jgi:hypothetical protein
MPSTLPEDIQAELKRDFARGISGFRGGASMPIGGLVLCKDTRISRFVVHCYSSKYFRENITRSEAQERIETAKEEVAHLFRLFPELEAEVHSLPLVFHFCHDYGKGAVSVATEEDGQFVYHSQA